MTLYVCSSDKDYLNTHLKKTATQMQGLSQGKAKDFLINTQYLRGTRDNLVHKLQLDRILTDTPYLLWVQESKTRLQTLG